MVRVCMIEDTQCNGSNPSTPFCFQDWSSVPFTLMSFEAQGTAAAGRYRILAEKWVRMKVSSSIVHNTVTYFYYQDQLFELSYDFGRKIVYKRPNSSSPTVAALSNCNIFLAVLRTDPNASEAVNLEFCGRAIYSD